MENQAPVRVTPAAIADDETLDLVPPEEIVRQVPCHQDAGDALFALNSLQLTRDTRLNSYSLLYPIEFLYDHLPSGVQDDVISWTAPGEPELFGDMSDARVAYINENYPDLTREQTEKSRALWSELGATEYLFMPVNTGDEHFVTAILRFGRGVAVPPAPGYEDRPFNTVIQYAIVDPVRGPDAEKRKRHVAEVLQCLCRIAHIDWSAEQRTIWVPPQDPEVDDWSSGLRSFALIRELFNRIVATYCQRRRYQETFWDPAPGWWNADQVRDEMIGMAARQVRKYMHWTPRVSLAYVHAPRDEEGQTGPFAPKINDSMFPTGEELPIPFAEGLPEGGHQRSEHAALLLRSAHRPVYTAVDSMDQFHGREPGEVDLAEFDNPKFLLQNAFGWLEQARAAVSELELDDPDNAKHQAALEHLESEFNEAGGLYLLFVARHALGAFEQAVRVYTDTNDDDAERISRSADEWYERTRQATYELTGLWPEAATDLEEKSRDLRHHLVVARHSRARVGHVPKLEELGDLARNAVATMGQADENDLGATSEDIGQQQGSLNEAAGLLEVWSDNADYPSGGPAAGTIKEEQETFTATWAGEAPSGKAVAIRTDTYATESVELATIMYVPEDTTEEKEVEIVETASKQDGPAQAQSWNKLEEEDEPARKKRKIDGDEGEAVGSAWVSETVGLFGIEQTKQENGGQNYEEEARDHNKTEVKVEKADGAEKAKDKEGQEMDGQQEQKQDQLDQLEYLKQQYYQLHQERQEQPKQDEQYVQQPLEQMGPHEQNGQFGQSLLEEQSHIEQYLQQGQQGQQEGLEQLEQLEGLVQYNQQGPHDPLEQQDRQEVAQLSDTDSLFDDTFDN